MNINFGLTSLPTSMVLPIPFPMLILYNHRCVLALSCLYIYIYLPLTKYCFYFVCIGQPEVTPPKVLDLLLNINDAFSSAGKFINH